jgi:hypothetical protein
MYKKSFRERLDRCTHLEDNYNGALCGTKGYSPE